MSNIRLWTSTTEVRLWLKRYHARRLREITSGKSSDYLLKLPLVIVDGKSEKQVATEWVDTLWYDEALVVFVPHTKTHYLGAVLVCAPNEVHWVPLYPVQLVDYQDVVTDFGGNIKREDIGRKIAFLGSAIGLR